MTPQTGTDWKADRRYIGTYFTSRRVTYRGNGREARTAIRVK
jgi:hypothetical protein